MTDTVVGIITEYIRHHSGFYTTTKIIDFLKVSDEVNPDDDIPQRETVKRQLID